MSSTTQDQTSKMLAVLESLYGCAGLGWKGKENRGQKGEGKAGIEGWGLTLPPDS